MNAHTPRNRSGVFRRLAFLVALGAAAPVSAARAAVIVGQPIALRDGADVSVRFVSQSAAAAGSLYFLGSEIGGVATRAASSDGLELGARLFDNHAAAPGDTVPLGRFDADSILHFAYLITRGFPEAPAGSLFRTDVSADLLYFAQQAMPADEPSVSITRVGVEDIRDIQRSDFDYNDIQFDVVARSAPVPAPSASFALLALAGAAALPRRRR